MRSHLNTLVRLLFTFACLWGVLASIMVRATAGGSMVTESNGITTTRNLSWVEMQGAWGVAILLIFAFLYYGPLHFFRRNQLGLSGLFAAAACILTLLAGFSIGGYYFVGGVALALGLTLLPFSGRNSRRIAH